MIIICRGIRNRGKVENCSFLHDGTWGDDELIKHQVYHESSSKPNAFWLGFDLQLSFGKYSGRDGKKS